MTNKEIFFKSWDEVIESNSELFPQEAKDYIESLRKENAKNPTEITENGRKNLDYMKENEALMSNMFTSKSIANGLSISSRSVAGSMRKLVTDGFVSKNGEPAVYRITDKGRDI